MDLPKNFSPVQHRILKELGNREMKLSTLAEKVYSESKVKPLSPRTAVRSAIQFINLKCEVHKLGWRITTDGVMGRDGCTVRKTKWL